MRTSRFVPGFASLITLSVVLSGCASRAPAPQSPAEVVAPIKRPARSKLVMEPIKLQAIKGADGPEVEVLEAGALFEQGGRLLSAKKYRDAIAAYDKLLANFPDSRYVSPTLYNAGLCHEWLGEFDRAARRYRALIEAFGATKEAVDAAFRLGGCYAELRNWPASAQVFQALLQRKDLSATDRIECLARKGLAHFRMGDRRKCKSTLQEALRFHKTIEAVERLDSDFFLGMAHYYLAALPHVDFRKLNVDPGKQMAQTLDEKARLLMLSQARYIKTIKVKNPHWATAAGFQVGSLYREFYTVLLTTLPDFERQAARNAKLAKISRQEAHKQLVQVYMEEVHKAVKPLLHKAIRVFEKNVLMARRIGIESNWVGKSRRQVQELKHLLSLPPAEVVKLVKRVKDQVPEDAKPLAPGQDPADQPAAGDPGAGEGEGPDRAPARPRPDTEDDREQPGRVVM